MINLIIILLVTFVGSNKIINLLHHNDEAAMNNKNRLTPYFTLKTIINQLIIVFLCGLFLNSLFTDIKITSIFIIILMVLYPLVFLSNVKRKEKEDIFDQILLYVSVTNLNLSENHNVFIALEKTLKHLKDPVRGDVKRIVDKLHSNNDISQILREFEDRYNYSIVRQLHIIMIHIINGSRENINEVLNQFIVDIDVLKTDINENNYIRKLMKFQYFGIGVLSLMLFGLSINSLSVNVLKEARDTADFRQFIQNIVVLIMMSMFMVEGFFNRTITKE